MFSVTVSLERHDAFGIGAFERSASWILVLREPPKKNLQ
jgi:hypothetical protein